MVESYRALALFRREVTTEGFRRRRSPAVREESDLLRRTVDLVKLVVVRGLDPFTVQANPILARRMILMTTGNAPH
ncbi:MAG TPA: hypothetical protein DIU48_09180 [Acidobacteria bacterium]|nr:hypothetical protein [Acidobacteriota bacterium]